MKTFFFLLMCGLGTATLSAQSLTGTVTDADRLSLSSPGSLKPDGKSTADAWGNVTDSHNGKRSDTQLHNAALNYTSGFGLSAGADYTYYKDESTQDFTDTEAEPSAFRSDSHQRIDRPA